MINSLITRSWRMHIYIYIYIHASELFKDGNDMAFRVRTYVFFIFQKIRHGQFTMNDQSK